MTIWRLNSSLVLNMVQVDRYVNIDAQLLTTSIMHGYYKYFISIRYSTIETKEAARIGYKRFLYIQLVIFNTGNFFCFHSNVSNLYNNDSIIYKIKRKSWEQFCLCTSLLYFYIIQVWTQKCAVQKASVDVNISYY